MYENLLLGKISKPYISKMDKNKPEFTIGDWDCNELFILETR
jgi:hypothetical protein